MISHSGEHAAHLMVPTFHDGKPHLLGAKDLESRGQAWFFIILKQQRTRRKNLDFIAAQRTRQTGLIRFPDSFFR